jgi:Alginate lyase
LPTRSEFDRKTIEQETERMIGKMAACLLLVATAGADANDAIGSLRKEAARAHAPAMAALRRDADAALRQKPLRVVDKTSVPPGGDKRDYYDLSPYYWPNPKSAGGLPYVFRDGRVNPEVEGNQFDRVSYGRMGDAARTLGLAYRLTGDEKYAVGAARVVRTWFLDPETGMRPNFNFSQHVRGIPGGQPIGIIRGMTIVELVDITRWLELSPHWTTRDRAEWRTWLAAYGDWLQTSELGRKEAQATNNHGTWYDVQLATILLATNRTDAARQVLAEVPKRRLARQIRPDGGQPLELRRTKSWDYSVMNLEAMFRLARLGESAGVDLWHWHDADGRSLRGALDFLSPFAVGKQRWNTRQIREFEGGKLEPLLRSAARAYQAPACDAAADHIVGFDGTSRREALWALAGIP